ncbi:MAG TPA: transcriptional regulator, partial [Dysgonomonas sp.]|nr:transcriptional regulator [Dysgonomonas sp.]
LEIWRLKECTVKDILNSLPDPKPNYTTLAAVVKNLEQKKYVYSKKFGNVYVYYPQVDESDYKRTFMKNVMNNYFDNSYKKLFSFFVKEEKLTPDQMKEIIRMIENEESN